MNKLVLSVILCFSASAFANSNYALNLADQILEAPAAVRLFDMDPKDMPQECTDVNLTDAQKLSLDTAFKAHRDDMQMRKAAIMDAKQAYVSTLASTTADAAAAEKAGTFLISKINDALTSALAFHNNVYLTILTPSQRDQAVKCEKKLIKRAIKAKAKKICEKDHADHAGYPEHHP